MAEVRKSAKLTAARALAREKAAEFRGVQDTLEQLAADYFVAAETLDDIAATALKEIVAVQSRAQEQSALTRTAAAAIISAMLDLGTPRAEVAARLGIETRDVTKHVPVRGA